MDRGRAGVRSERQYSPGIAGRVGPSDESKRVKSAAAKPEENKQPEGANMLDEAEKTRFRSWAPPLNYPAGQNSY